MCTAEAEYIVYTRARARVYLYYNVYTSVLCARVHTRVAAVEMMAEAVEVAVEGRRLFGCAAKEKRLYDDGARVYVYNITVNTGRRDE